MNDTIKQKIAEMKQHVTYFSEQLKREAVHEQDVVVGGKITSIVPLTDFDERYPMYIVILDDLVGQVHVFVPDEMMQVYADEFQIGNYVFVEGFVNVITRRIHKELKRDISIFAYNLKEISINEGTKP
jgi:hypothetical protein